MGNMLATSESEELPMRGYATNKDDYLKRLRRIEGQVRGLQRMIDEDVGYVKLRGFPEPSVVDTIERNVASFQESGVRGLVLDLRGNSGGRIDQA